MPRSRQCGADDAEQGRGGELSPTQVAAGQQAVGTILFDVDQARAAGAKVQLDDMGLAFGEPLAWWQL